MLKRQWLRKVVMKRQLRIYALCFLCVINPKSVINHTLFFFLFKYDACSIYICCAVDDDSIFFTNALVECCWCGFVTYSVCCFIRPFYLNK